MESTQSMNDFILKSKQAVPNLRGRHLKRISQATFWVSLAAFLIIFPLILSSGAIVYFQTQNINLPGVVVYDRPVGWLNSEETSAFIDALWNKNRTINLDLVSDPEVSYSLYPAQLGLWVDPKGTADAAYAIGRGAQPFNDIRLSIQGEPQIVFPVLYFDEKIARETLAGIANELKIQAQNAQILYQDGAWVALPGSEGRQVDIDSTLEELYENAFDILVTGSASLEIMAQSPAIMDLTPVLKEIDGTLSQDLRLAAYDPINDESFNWSVPLETKRSWISVNPDDYSVSLEYDINDITALLESWQSSIGEERSFLQAAPEMVLEDWQAGQKAKIIIQHDPTTYTVSAGESLWSISLKLGMPMYHIMDANPGLTTNNIEAGMTLTIPSKNILLPLPVIKNKRIVIDISEQTMTVYEDGQVRNTYIVSTGISDSPTMPGIFQVQTHELNAYASNWDLYMPHFMGIYEAWPGFMNGIHGLPLLSSGVRLWASTLGSPASYGCIILDLPAAEDLYNWADPGVVVEITR